MTPTNTQVLVQWIFFFALMSVIFLPAILFRKIAVQHNKKGWLFLLFGLAVGVFALNVGRLALYPLTSLSIADRYQPYLIAIPFVVGYVVVFFAIRLLKEKLGQKP
jgi:hypothetical protein